MSDYPTDAIDALNDPLEPQWLGQVLRASRSVLHTSAFMSPPVPASGEFSKQCLDAAHVALTLSKLRVERKRLGFVPLSIRDYLSSLAQSAQVALEPALRWAGIRELSTMNVGFASSWARFAKGLGMEVEEAVMLFRISFLDAQSPDAAAPALARNALLGRGMDGRVNLESSVEGWIRKLAVAPRKALATAEDEIRQFFSTDQPTSE
jgi:hypothetical protein